jgi:hypothetical protein
MKAVLIQLAWKYLLPIVLKELEEAGVIDSATKYLSMTILDFINFAKTIKSYHKIEDFPNAPKKATSTCNLKTRSGKQVNEGVE